MPIAERTIGNAADEDIDGNSQERCQDHAAEQLFVFKSFGVVVHESTKTEVATSKEKVRDKCTNHAQASTYAQASEN
jgi:hypothetical protein